MTKDEIFSRITSYFNQSQNDFEILTNGCLFNLDCFLKAEILFSLIVAFFDQAVGGIYQVIIVQQMNFSFIPCFALDSAGFVIEV